jgi:hypothetical protein
VTGVEFLEVIDKLEAEWPGVSGPQGPWSEEAVRGLAEQTRPYTLASVLFAVARLRSKIGSKFRPDPADILRLVIDERLGEPDPQFNALPDPAERIDAVPWRQACMVLEGEYRPLADVSKGAA